MKQSHSRREFLRRSSLTGAGIVLATTVPARARRVSANEKLNLGIIGVANRGAEDLAGVSGENIVALCDVNEKYLAATAQKFPGAKTYNDFRRLLDQKEIDAVVIATPDHTHAVAAVAALRSGRHVYCEKPLTRTMSECRIVMEAARKAKRVTQIGTQIHAGTNYRRVVELVQSGTIGTVAEVHVWVNTTYGGKDRPHEQPPVPPELSYDLWLGPVPALPYSPEYVPFNWRNWWAFGGGALADFGCHFMDLPHWALDLREPISAEAIAGPPVHPDSTPPWLVVEYRHPARGEKPPLKLTWYHGGRQPAAAVLAPELAQKWKGGILFLGSKGQVLADYGNHLLLPEKEFAGFAPPKPFITDSIGHHTEWINACKTGGPTTCNFDYSGALTQAALLGNVAYRTGKKIEWDAQKLRARNCPEADQFIQHHYRKGWKI